MPSRASTWETCFCASGVGAERLTGRLLDGLVEVAERRCEPGVPWHAVEQVGRERLGQAGRLVVEQRRPADAEARVGRVDREAEGADACELRRDLVELRLRHRTARGFGPALLRVRDELLQRRPRRVADDDVVAGQRRERVLVVGGVGQAIARCGEAVDRGSDRRLRVRDEGGVVRDGHGRGRALAVGEDVEAAVRACGLHVLLLRERALEAALVGDLGEPEHCRVGAVGRDVEDADRNLGAQPGAHLRERRPAVGGLVRGLVELRHELRPAREARAQRPAGASRRRTSRRCWHRRRRRSKRGTPGRRGRRSRRRRRLRRPRSSRRSRRARRPPGRAQRTRPGGGGRR